MDPKELGRLAQEVSAEDVVKYEGSPEYQMVLAKGEALIQGYVTQQLKNDTPTAALFNALPERYQHFILAFNHHPANRPGPEVAATPFLQNLTRYKSHPNSIRNEFCRTVFARFDVKSVMVNLYGPEATLEIIEPYCVGVSLLELQRLVFREIKTTVLDDLKKEVIREKLSDAMEHILDNAEDPELKLAATDRLTKLYSLNVQKTETVNVNLDFTAMLERLDARDEEYRQKKRLEEMKSAGSEVVE